MLEPNKLGKGERKTSKVLEPKKEEKRGRERRSNKEMLEPKKSGIAKGGKKPKVL